MQTWPTNIAAITLFQEDLTAARTFYAEVLGLPLVFADDGSAAYQLGDTLINLLATTAAHELVAPAVPGSPESGLRAQLTIEVDDVDARCAQLRAQGVELLNGPVDRPWGVRTASFRDPGGHLWEIGA